MHLRVGAISGRMLGGCNTHIHTRPPTHKHTHAWRCNWSYRLGAELRPTPHIPPITTTAHHIHTTTCNTSNQDSGNHRKGTGENSNTNPYLVTPTPTQHVSRGELGTVGLLGLGRGHRNSPGMKDVEKKPEDWNDILNRWYVQYQDFIGITDLKRAQDRVTELSDGLLEAQGERRRLQAEMESLQGQLVENHQRITKTEQYSQEHMTLFSEARTLNERLRQVRAEFIEYERRERETFTHLSSAIRDCHERERMQAEQSKYWSIIASVVSAALASVITSVNNWVRIKEIKEHITTSHQTLLDGYERMQADILASLNGHDAPAQPHTPATPLQPPTPEHIEKMKEDVTVFSADVKRELAAFTDDVISRIQATLSASTAEVSISKPSALPATSPGVSGVVQSAPGEVSYPRVAAAMMVGAGLGTLITAFCLGALGGSAG